MKLSETPEERNARRAAKKAMKAASRGGGGNTDALGASNPIGDASAKPFVWKKKYEKAIEEGLDPQILSREQLAQKQQLLAAEIAAIKARKVHINNS